MPWGGSQLQKGRTLVLACLGGIRIFPGLPFPGLGGSRDEVHEPASHILQAIPGEGAGEGGAGVLALEIQAPGGGAGGPPG